MDRNKNNQTSHATPMTVRIVHVNGQPDCMIEYFCQTTITFGRNPSCDVVFPSDLLIVSRLHAMISRHGNRYVLKNLSPNGCYVNSIKKDECILKEGDLISFADGGPVVTFTLSCQHRDSNPIPENKSAGNQKPLRSSNVRSEYFLEPPTLLTKASADFTFQYGTYIKSYHQINVIIGTGQCCDFVIAHPKVDEKQFQIHFRDNKYILRDLSETNSTFINNDNFIGDIRLNSGDIITLNVANVQLIYLGEGRISEYNPKKYTEINLPEDFELASANPEEQNCTKHSVFDVFDVPDKKH